MKKHLTTMEKERLAIEKKHGKPKKPSKKSYEMEAARDDAIDYASHDGKKPKMAVVKLGKHSKEDLHEAAKHMKKHGG